MLVSSFNAIAKEQKIIAIVNNEIITDLDIQKRTQLAMVSSGMAYDNKTYEMIKKQVLQTLIDDKLVAQAANKLNIEVDKDEIDAALHNIAEKNGIKISGLEGFLQHNKIDKDAFIEQVKHQLLWNKVIKLYLEPKVNVSDREVEESATTVKKDILNSKDINEQVKLAEIVLFANDKEDANKVFALAQQIVKKIKQGADFKELVSQFSQAASASQKGEIGWVYTYQLTPNIAKIIKITTIGEVTEPVIMDDGIHIIKILDKKSKKEDLQEEINLDQIKEMLLNKKLDLEIKAFLKKLHKETYIKINN